MAWYIDSKNVKKNEVEAANARYEKIWKPGEMNRPWVSWRVFYL